MLWKKRKKEVKKIIKGYYYRYSLTSRMAILFDQQFRGVALTIYTVYHDIIDAYRRSNELF